MTDLGFKGNFLIQMEFPNYTVGEIVTIFFDKAYGKGYVFDPAVTAEFVISLIEKNSDDEWRNARNGRVADMLLHSVRSEIKKKLKVAEESSPIKTKRLQATSPGAEEITITAQIVQNDVKEF